MDETESEWQTVNRKRKTVNFPKNKKKKKILQNELGIDDLNDLKSYEDSHTNLLKMQINELLKDQLKINETVTSWLEEFEQFLLHLPEGSQSSIKDFSVGKEIKIPISQMPETDKGVFKFLPPSRIVYVGAYAFETIHSSSPVIDIAVEIPKPCWQGMDNLNYRYHRKRAFYLTSIAHSLLDSDMVSNLRFIYQNDCDIKPDLLITARGISDFSFRLTAFPCKEAFKESRFHSDKNNIRASWLYGDIDATDEPTPFYNCTVLADLLLIKLNDHIKSSLSSQSLKEAVILLKIWAYTRELTSGYGRLNGFILSAFLLSMLQNKRISSYMNSYEIFKYALLELSSNSFPRNIFKDVTDYDIIFSVSEETLLMLKHEAKLALALLNSTSVDTFTLLFMKKIAIVEKFEYLLHLRNFKLDSLSELCEKLKEGLGNRILLLDVVKSPFESWPITSSPPDGNKNLITVGFLLNPDVPLSNLEKGPLANDPKAKSFREFWGDQSELRRFQDGSVREAVFWPAVTMADKREVFCTILKDIVGRHFKVLKAEITVNGVETECVLKLPDIILSKEFSAYGTGEESLTKLMQSFNDLSKQLRSLKLPLLVASIQGISPAFRFTEVFPPLSMLHKVDTSKCYVDGQVMKLKNDLFKVLPYVPALKAVLHFEGSGKWPNDVEALKRVKAAFQIKIAELAKSQCSLMAIPFATHTDIFKDGFVFRFEVACHKEINLLKQIRSPDGSIKIKETKESQKLEVSTKILPKLSSVLHGLHQQHNSYGTACRIAKRWIASQLKNKFIHDLTIELIVASLYVHPEPFTFPSSPQTAFIRFLSLLITHNWAAVPLIVNFNQELSVEDIEEINLNFTSQRSTLPPMVVVTPFDKKGNMWTKNMPPAVILKRIIILAEASLNTLKKAFLDCKFFDCKVLFRPPLHSFDVIIHLKRKEIPKLSYAVDVRINDPLPLFEPYEYDMNEVYPVVEFDPVQNYLEELIENFGDCAVFLNDPYGGDFIAVKWKSAAFQPENAKTCHGCKLIPNVEEILENFKILGEGLVKNIECKTENWQLR